MGVLSASLIIRPLQELTLSYPFHKDYEKRDDLDKVKKD
jgi:hypothetical protein